MYVAQEIERITFGYEETAELKVGDGDVTRIEEHPHPNMPAGEVYEKCYVVWKGEQVFAKYNIQAVAGVYYKSNG